MITRLGCTLLLGTLLSAYAPAQAAPSTDAPPILVELFTSEGCSSCPPADRLLQQLSGRHTGSGAPVIVLSEHVTYWDHLGWKDPFSSAALTSRQSAYSDRFHLDSVYTPQMVINGRDQTVGSNARVVVQLLESQPASNATLHIRNVHPEAGGVSATISLQNTPPSAELYAVVAQDTATTDVGRGENSGRKLTHVSVARSLSRIAFAGTGDSIAVRLSAKELQSTQGQKRHLIIFAQASGAGAILAADSTPL